MKIDREGCNMVSDTFSEREKAFENKFKMDEEVRFKIHSKAVRLFGLWAAGQLGIAHREAESYANKIVEANVHSPEINGLIAKVHSDLKGRGVEISDRVLHNQFNAKLEQARRMIFSQERL
jgi:hypothetical protein